jgi:hypothetical protein
MRQKEAKAAHTTRQPSMENAFLFQKKNITVKTTLSYQIPSPWALVSKINSALGGHLNFYLN